MQYTEIIYLIKTIETTDSIGNIKHTESQTKVYAKKNKVGSNEFYNAVAVGIKPEAELQIRTLNYNDEELVLYNNIRYSVIRTIPKSKTDLVLVIGRKIGTNG